MTLITGAYLECHRSAFMISIQNLKPEQCLHETSNHYHEKIVVILGSLDVTLFGTKLDETLIRLAIFRVFVCSS
jgi:hypothetical protein